MNSAADTLHTMEVLGHDEYDHEKELRAFADTKAGVKGLADLGITKLPGIFIHPLESLHQNPSPPDYDLPDVPVIDFNNLQNNRLRKKIIDDIRCAAETWGFFQMVNHGVPFAVMDALLEAVRQFHEQPRDAKLEFYSDDSSRPVRFESYQGDLYSSAPADWRDSMSCKFPDDRKLDLETLPLFCRREIGEYMKHMMGLKKILGELLSEALGLSSESLSSTGFMKSSLLLGHYYPPCPEPYLTLGSAKHSDLPFFTILLQDNIGGLQVLHQNHWVDVPSLHGALILNIGDLMQLVTNDRFKSMGHRVVSKKVGPRISAACFFFPTYEANAGQLCGPLKELVSHDNPSRYREVSYSEYMGYFMLKAKDGATRCSPLPYLKL